MKYCLQSIVNVEGGADIERTPSEHRCSSIAFVAVNVFTFASMRAISAISERLFASRTSVTTCSTGILSRSEAVANEYSCQFVMIRGTATLEGTSPKCFWLSAMFAQLANAWPGGSIGENTVSLSSMHIRANLRPLISVYLIPYGLDALVAGP